MSKGVELAEQDRFLESAYARDAASLTNYLSSLTRDRAAAEVLAQEAFVRLAAEVRADRRPDDATAWLFRVASNLAASRGRKMSVADRHANVVKPPGPGIQPDRAAIGRELGATLDQALASLGSSERTAVLLAAEGYRAEEIGRVVGRSAGAARTLLCRGRAKLRRNSAVASLIAA
jgi:RNA polymerase sigma-70 factor (ECF subfamily)